MENNISEISLQERLETDLEYIKNDLLCMTGINKKTKEKEYCKFSRALNAITILSTTEKRIIDYWSQYYLHHPKEKAIIIKACEDKLKNGLVPKERMIELVKNSKDNSNEKELMLNYLLGKSKTVEPVKITKKELYLRSLGIIK